MLWQNSWYMFKVSHFFTVGRTRHVHCERVELVVQGVGVVEEAVEEQGAACGREWDGGGEGDGDDVRTLSKCN